MSDKRYIRHAGTSNLARAAWDANDRPSVLIAATCALGDMDVGESVHGIEVVDGKTLLEAFDDAVVTLRRMVVANESRFAGQAAGYGSSNAATCETCQFYLRGNGSFGNCRRFPPTKGWPEMKPEQWCGEYVSASKEPT